MRRCIQCGKWLRFYDRKVKLLDAVVCRTSSPMSNSIGTSSFAVSITTRGRASVGPMGLMNSCVFSVTAS